MTERPVLTRLEAAEYVGCRDTAQFRREVSRGIWPKSIAPGRWSREALDLRIRERAGLAPEAEPASSLAEDTRQWRPTDSAPKASRYAP